MVGRSGFTVSAACVVIGVAACGSASTAQVPSVPTGTTPAVVAPWSDVASADVAAPSEGTTARLVPHAGGAALITWPITAKDGQAPFRTGVVARTDQAGLGAPQVLNRWLVDEPQARDDGRTDLLLARRSPSWELSKLEVRTVERSGAVGAPQRIAVDGNLSDASLAVAGSGAAVLAWTELKPVSDLGDYGEGWNVSVKVALRKAGATKFGSPRRLQRAFGLADGPVEVAIDGTGRVVVAYDDHRYGKSPWGVRAWTGSVSGGVRPRSVRIGASATTTTLKAALLPSGRAVVAWGTISHGEEPHSPWKVRAATLTPGGKQLGTTQLVDGDGAEAWTPEAMALAAGPDGSATLAWSHEGRGGGAATEVRSAVAHDGGRFAAAQRFTSVAQVGGLATRADGTQVLTVGASPDATSGRTWAALRRPGGAGFGDLELLGTPLDVLGYDGLNRLLSVPAPAFDPESGRPAVAWVSKRGAAATVSVQQRDRP